MIKLKIALQNILLLVLLLSVLIIPLHAIDDLGDTSQPTTTIDAAPALPQQITPSLDNTTYLFYFESDDAVLTTKRTKRYSFSTLPDDKITILVYGLDNQIMPRLALYDAEGSLIREGTSPVTPYVTGLEFTTRDKEDFFFEVAALNNANGVVRVMLFEGDPYNDDLTLVDIINPLLPGRAFLVAGDHIDPAIDGLNVRVEVLPVPRFDEQRPEVFASRGTDADDPPQEERFTPLVQRGWVNSSDIPVYTINVRAAPEPLANTRAMIDYNKSLNLNTFFYFEYHLIIGAGSVPQLLVRGDPCQLNPNRPECIQTSTSPNTQPIDSSPAAIPIAPAAPPPPQLEEFLGVPFFLLPILEEVIVLPDVVECSFGPFFIYQIYFGTPDDNQDVPGSECIDIMFGEGGEDIFAGGAGFDQLYGGADDDVLFGGADDDYLVGGTGNDIINGEDGYDTFALYDLPVGVTVNLNGGGVGIVITNDVAQETDVFSNIEQIEGTNFDDTFILAGDQSGGATIFGSGGIDSYEFENTFVGFASIYDFGCPLNAAGMTTAQLDRLDFSAITGGGIDAGLPGGGGSGWVSGPNLSVTIGADGPCGIIGTAQNDTFTASTTWGNVIDGGANTALGSNPADPFAGGDLISYVWQSGAVTVDLTNNFATKPGGLSDALYNLENINGSNYSDGNAATTEDTLIGNGDGNRVDPWAGDDIINTLGGNDIILDYAGEGNDQIDGGADVDLLWLTGGNFTTVNYNNTAGTAIVLGFLIETNTFTGIENITTNFSADTFNITPDAVNNIFDAGSNVDTARYDGFAGAVTFDVSGTTIITAGGTDTLINFENYVGADGVDTLNITNTTGITLTDYNTGLGNDIITVNNTGALPVRINGGDGDDTFTVSPDANADVFDGGTNTAAGDTFTVAGGGVVALTYNGLADSVINGDTVRNFENFNLGDGGVNITVTTVADGVINNFGGGTNTDSLTYTVATNLYVDYNAGGNGSISNALPGTPPTAGALLDNFAAMENLATGIGNDYFVIEFDGTNSILNGGTGTDGADYTPTGAAMTFLLNTAGSATAYQGGAISDTLLGFETLVGTGVADIFTISDANGFTSIQGGGGDDDFDVGFDAADTYGTGFDGGAGGGDTLDFSTTTTGVILNLDATGSGTSNRGVGVDTVTGFENFVGTTIGDTFNITADGAVTNFDGNTGTDVIRVQGALATDAVDIVYNGAGDADITVNGVTDNATNIETFRTGGGDDVIRIDVLDAPAAGNYTFAGGGNNLIGDTLAFNLAVDEVLTVTYTGNGDGTVAGTTNTINFENMEIITTEGAADTFLITADAVNNTFNAGANAGGVDLLSYTSATPITLNYTGGGDGTVVAGGTDTFTDFESFASADGNDIYNVLYEVATGDLNFNAGLGTDTLDYTTSVTPLRFNIGVVTGGFARTWVDDDDNFATADNHLFSNFEIVRGSAVGDQFRINNATGFTQFDGGAGNDTFNVNDTTTAFGTLGNPGLLGGDGNDLFLIDWDNNNDFIDGGTNTNAVGDQYRPTLAGGATSDYPAVPLDVVYTGSGAATVTDGTSTDTLTNFETIQTGTGADDFTAAWDTTNNFFDARTQPGGTEDTFTLSTNTNVTVNVGGVGANGTMGIPAGTPTSTIVAAGNTDTLYNFESITTAGGDDIFNIDTNSNQTYTINAGTSITGNTFNFTGAGTGTGLVNIFTSSGNLDWLNFSAITGTGVNIDMSNTATAQTIFGGFQIFLHNAIENLEGTNQADNITGTDNANTINANGGADVVDAAGGDDVVNGGAGGDTLYGGLGNDVVNGGIGADTIYGGVACGGTVAPSIAIVVVPAGSVDGADTVDGGADNDVVYGGNNNSAETNAGDCVDSGDTLVTGGADADDIFGGNNNANGGTGADGGDIINDNQGVDNIYGGNNNTGGGNGDDTGMDIISADDTPDDDDTIYTDNAGGAGGTSGDISTDTDPGEVDGAGNGP